MIGLEADESVWKLAAGLAAAETPVEVAEALARNGGEAAGGSFANLAIVEPGTARVRVVHLALLDPDRARQWSTLELSDQVPSCEAIRTGLPVLVASEQDLKERSPRLVSLAEATGLVARAAIPLRSAGGSILGAVVFGWMGAQAYTETQLRRLDLIGQLSGLALERTSARHGDRWQSERLPNVLDTMPNAFVSVDTDFVITYVNAQAQRVLGAPREQLMGACLWDALGESGDTGFETQFRQSLQQGRSVVFEQYYAARDTWFEVHAWPDHQGLNVSFVNINERQSSERRAAEALDDATSANARLSFLTDVSSALSGAPTRLAVFERLARAVIPAMADWCTIVEPEGDALLRVAAVHREPALDALAQRLIGTYPHSFSGPSPGVVVFRSQEPLRTDRLVSGIVADLDGSVASAAYGRTLQLLGDGPGLIVPIFLDGEVTAVLTMTRVNGEPYSDADVATLREAAIAVGVSLEGARHIQSERQTAAALQAAALPKALPVSARVQLAAGYRAASEGSQVGGDWYDAFELDDGRLTLVVGDAAGHGLEAAALMAQMRNVLRAHLFAGLGPSESLARLCGLLAVQEPDAFATIICVEIDPGSGETVWTSAGHPGPILARADGTSVHLRGQAAPPIGWSFLLSPSHPEHRLILEHGDRLLLFTDGLVERRGVDLDIGIANLMFVAERTHRGAEIQGACEAILRDMLPGSHEDDACLLVVDYKAASDERRPPPA